jgi:hypothetical protein
VKTFLLFAWLASFALAQATNPPVAVTATVGQTATLSASASGTPPFTYQWQKNGTVIAGQVGQQMLIASVATTDAASYTCVISNPAGSATTNAAVLTVNIPITAPANGNLTITITH